MDFTIHADATQHWEGKAQSHLNEKQLKRVPDPESKRDKSIEAAHRSASVVLYDAFAQRNITGIFSFFLCGFVDACCLPEKNSALQAFAVAAVMCIACFFEFAAGN